MNHILNDKPVTAKQYFTPEVIDTDDGPVELRFGDWVIDGRVYPFDKVHIRRNVLRIDRRRRVHLEGA